MYIFDDYLDFEAIPTDNNNFLGYYDASGNLIYSGSAIDATEVGMYFELGQHVYAAFDGEYSPI